MSLGGIWVKMASEVTLEGYQGLAGNILSSARVRVCVNILISVCAQLGLGILAREPYHKGTLLGITEGFLEVVTGVLAGGRTL